MFPEIAIPRLPFMGAMRCGCRSLANAEALLRQEGMTMRRLGAALVVRFPMSLAPRMAVRRECRRSALAKLKRAAMEDEEWSGALMSDRDPKPWQDQLFETLKGADIRQVGYVPDAGQLAPDRAL